MPPKEDVSAAALDRVFADLDALFAASTCPRSTRCCRFRGTGRVPYVWPVEARRVLTAIARRGGRLPRPPVEGACPLLLADGACAIYPDRPFGCRTFFCARATLPDGHRRREVDPLAKRLRAISEARGERELMPLSTVLARAFDASGRSKRA